MLGSSEGLRKHIEHIELNADDMSEVKCKSIVNSLKMSLEMCECGL